MIDIQSPLTDDEAAVLEIASKAGIIAAIGRWEEPARSLLKRGFLRDMSGDGFNCSITPAGIAARDGQQAEDDRALGKTVDRMRDIAIAQKSIQEMAEQCAKVLVKIAEASAVVTGRSKEADAQNWSKVILDHALRSMR